MKPNPPTKDDASRKRKVHKKSRRGCRNCKLRRVKCDEGKPQCTNCVKFRVACNFDPNNGDLQLPYAGQAFLFFQEQSSLILPERINPPPVLSPIITDGYTGFKMDNETMDRFVRFKTRTILSVGTEQGAEVYRKEIPKLAFAHPFLMHIIQSVTAIHDRYLSPNPDRPSVAELQHWSLAASQFNQKLSRPLKPDDYDALWSTAALLGVIAFASTSAASPEEAWPLKEGSHLEWLALSEGKKTIWKLASPLGRDSVFLRSLSQDMLEAPFSTRLKCSIEQVPPALVELFDLTRYPDNNPYLAAVLFLTPMMKMKFTRSAIPVFFSFIGHIQRDLKEGLDRKEPRTLLLMSMWYAKICDTNWWINKRATLECQSTCLYLEKYHGHDARIQEQLKYPRMRCGLDSGALLTPISNF